MRPIRLLAGFLALLLPFSATAQTASSIRSGDPVAASRIAAPTGSGSVFIPKVTITDTSGNAATFTTTTTGTVAIDQTTPGTTNGVVATGNVASAATDSGNPVKIGGRYNVTPPTLTDGQRGDGSLDSRANFKVTILGLNGSSGAAVNQANSDAVSASTFVLTTQNFGMVWNGATWDRMKGDTSGTATVAKPVTTGGLTPSRLVGATNGVIKASAGQLYTCTLTNTNAAIRYLELYNKATAGTLSTDTPVTTIPLPPNATVFWGSDAIGQAFATGISWQYVTDDIAIPTTAGTATEIHGSCTFK